MSRTGFTCCRTYSNGASNRLASASDMVPKSMIHRPEGRRVMSMPFSSGRTTSAFLRPFGSATRCRQIRKDLGHLGPVQARRHALLPVKAHHRHAHRCTVHGPGFVRPCLEYAAALGDRFQHLAVRAAADGVGRDQPSPPLVLVAPFSKVNHSPLGSAVTGSSMSSRRQRSRKCACEALRSLSSTLRHLVMKACGVKSISECFL